MNAREHRHSKLRRSMRTGLSFLVVAAVALPFACGAALAGSIMYRPAATGNWIRVAGFKDPLPVTSAFSGGAFASNITSSSNQGPTLATTSACGGASLVAFGASVAGAAVGPSGIFLYDAVTRTLHDVVVDGAATPIGGAWALLWRSNPQVVIDPVGCTVHVLFVDRIVGAASEEVDTGLFDATFDLPGLTATGVATLVQEGVTAAPLPFSAGTLFGEPGFRSVLSAVYGGPSGIVVAFPSGVSGGGVHPGTDSGIFSWQTGGTLTTHARAGDFGCAPPWPGAGARYRDFGPTNRVSAAVIGSPAVTFNAQSVGGTSLADTAIVQNQLGCGGTNVVQAAEGAVTPVGGTYGDLLLYTGLAGNSAGDTVFSVPIIGVPGVVRAVVRSTGSVVARDSMADSALGGSLLHIYASGSGAPVPAINGSGDVVFSARPFGGRSGLFFDTPMILPELLVQRGTRARIDDFGNVVAQFR